MDQESSDTRRYDAVIIGAGQSGVPLSTALAEAGWKVALIERKHVGGTCVNEGCTPTKTMAASARVAYLTHRSEDYGVHTGPVSIDMQAVRRRKREMVDSFRSGNRNRIERAEGVDLWMGEARFTGPKSILVKLNDQGELHLAADRVFINTGGRPRIPNLPGLDQAPYLDSTSIMELDHVPEHLLVLGGGYVGLEFSQMFRRFGSEVTIVQRADQLLPLEDEDIAEEIASILRQDGIKIHLSSEARRVWQSEDGKIHMAIDTPNGEQELKGTHLLVAVGRVPNTESLHLQSAGVETDSHGYIRANERLETNVAGVYALGDVKGGPAFTHISYDDYRILRANLLEGGQRTVDDRLVPYVVFIDPQLGRVGLSEKEARKSDREIRVARLPMQHVARALETEETRGFMKAVIDAETQCILGCAILGVNGGETMAILETAMLGNLPYTVLMNAVYAHPTLAESLNNLFTNLEK